MAITHTFKDGTVWEFINETQRRMCVLDLEAFAEPNDDLVCRWCRYARTFCNNVKAWRCGAYPEGKPYAVDFSAPCEKFEDDGSGKRFSKDVLAENLPKDAEIRKALIERLRKDFGNEVAIVGNQAIHVGRMGVYAANIYSGPGNYFPDHLRIDSGNLGIRVLDEIANASTLLREAWNWKKMLWILAKDGNLEEFKLMPFICYAPSQVKAREKSVALGRRIGDRVHWAFVYPEGRHLNAEYAGSTPAENADSAPTDA